MSAKWRATCCGMLQPMLSLLIAHRRFLMRAGESVFSVSGLGYLPRCAATLGRHARSCGVCTLDPQECCRLGDALSAGCGPSATGCGDC